MTHPVVVRRCRKPRTFSLVNSDFDLNLSNGLGVLALND